MNKNNPAKDDINIEKTKEGIVFIAKVIPSSSKTALCGNINGMLKIKISAPPKKHKANICMIKFLSKHFDVKKKDISIISGHTSNIKHVKISGLSVEMLQQKLISLKGS